MTTIAYSNGIVAADKRLMFDDTIMSDSMVKLRRLDCGWVVAVVGDPVYLDTYARWLELDDDGDANQPKISKSDIAVFKPDDTVTIYDENGEITLTAEVFALGSGKSPALAALHMGATAEEAVKIASRVDPYTSQETTFMRVGDG